MLNGIVLNGINKGNNRHLKKTGTCSLPSIINLESEQQSEIHFSALQLIIYAEVLSLSPQRAILFLSLSESIEEDRDAYATR